MFCTNCGNPVDPTTGVCAGCNAQYTVNPQPVRAEITEKDLPEKFKPMGAWSYFWLRVLFGVPVVGFIFLIIFSFSKGNLNRRNYARSFWCAWLVVAVIAVIFFLIVFIIALISGMSMADIASSTAPAVMY